MFNPIAPALAKISRYQSALRPIPCAAPAPRERKPAVTRTPCARSLMVCGLGPSTIPAGAKRPIRVTSVALAMMVSSGFVVLLLALVFFPDTRGFGAMPSDATQVKITPRRVGDVTRVYVENSELSEVTMTFLFSMKNLKSSVKFPYTATFKPGETEAFDLTPVDRGTGWEYSYTNYYKLGSCDAVPDDTVYLLPYTPGKAFRVTQGYNGKFSHFGQNQYAIDWNMREGTPVRAARGGLVVKVKDDGELGGPSLRYDPYDNYVIIRHDDGTLGQYCHLKLGGVKVFPGQRVRAGDLIALSGNTGFSSGSHLHFCVFKTRDGRERLSIPVKFRDNDGDPVTLAEGRKYKAPEIEARSTVVAQDGHALPAF